MTSTKNDQICDPPPTSSAISDNRSGKTWQISKISHSRVDIINLWSVAPQTFKTNCLTYLSVDLRFQERKNLNF